MSVDPVVFDAATWCDLHNTGSAPMTGALEALLRVASVGLHGRDWTFVAPHSQATFMAAQGDNFFVL